MEKHSGTLMTRVAAGERINIISAFSTMHSLVIGQIKTDKKSNEITAIPELLNMLDIKGKIITTDAMGCQKDIAEKIKTGR
ncbi:ISAs1 family transposase [Escherichia coli]